MNKKDEDKLVLIAAHYPFSIGEIRACYNVTNSVEVTIKACDVAVSFGMSSLFPITELLICGLPELVNAPLFPQRIGPSEHK